MQLLLKTFEREESVMATNNTTHEQENDLRPEKGIFWPAMIGVLLIALPMLFFPKASEEIIGAIYTPFSIKFGSLYLWITVGLIILCVYFACSRYGDIKFGDPGEKPQYSLPSWVAMIFCSATVMFPFGASSFFPNDSITVPSGTAMMLPHDRNDELATSSTLVPPIPFTSSRITCGYSSGYIDFMFAGCVIIPACSRVGVNDGYGDGPS